MNVDDMMIGGYSVAQLKEIQAAVKKDASKVIAEALKEGTDAMDELLEIEEDEEDAGSRAMALAQLAKNKLEIVDIVSGISGVSYYLPYDYDYESPYTSKLDDFWFDTGYMSEIKLFTLVDSMTSESRNWNQSTC